MYFPLSKILFRTRLYNGLHHLKAEAFFQGFFFQEITIQTHNGYDVI